MKTIDRRTFLRRTGIASGALAASGPLGAFTANAMAQQSESAVGYGPLVPKTDARGNTLLLPAAFEFVTVQQQGEPMRDGQPVPGVFDGMGAFPAKEGGATILIRNHENREQAGEQKVVTGPAFEYDPTAFGGNTKVVVDTGRSSADAAIRPRVVRDPRRHLDELRRRRDAVAVVDHLRGGRQAPRGLQARLRVRDRCGRRGPVRAIPAPQCGRRAHEAVAWTGGILYLTEDRSLQTFGEGPGGPAETLGSVFYRFLPKRSPGRNGNLAEIPGVLQGLKLVNEPKANMDVGRVPGQPYAVEWVDVPEPDHEDDTDNRRDRWPGFTPNRVQAIDRGAAYFDRTEGSWVGNGKVYFDCTSGGPVSGGQIWEYDPGRETLTLIYESNDRTRLEAPDNIVVVPQTGDILAQEDGGGDQFIRGVTRDGRIYDFARTGNNNSEFCGGCFDPNGQILYVNLQGERGSLPEGPADGQAVTFAIFGPFEKRDGDRGVGGFGNGPAI